MKFYTLIDEDTKKINNTITSISVVYLTPELVAVELPKRMLRLVNEKSYWPLILDGTLVQVEVDSESLIFKNNILCAINCEIITELPFSFIFGPNGEQILSKLENLVKTNLLFPRTNFIENFRFVRKLRADQVWLQHLKLLRHYTNKYEIPNIYIASKEWLELTNTYYRNQVSFAYSHDLGINYESIIALVTFIMYKKLRPYYDQHGWPYNTSIYSIMAAAIAIADFTIEENVTFQPIIEMAQKGILVAPAAMGLKYNDTQLEAILIPVFFDTNWHIYEDNWPGIETVLENMFNIKITREE